VEALLVYGYLNRLVSLEEAVEQISVMPDSPVDTFAHLIKLVANRIEDLKLNPA
jgi:hypothetical protein